MAWYVNKNLAVFDVPHTYISGGFIDFVDDVMRDLYEEGFMPNYYWWTNHGEELPQFPPILLQGSYYESGGQRKKLNPYEQMIMDHAGPSIGQYIE
ncbi:hypothetical protein JHK87_031669 [Glycine soja]|nr:hypothetical protein JHK87_031669 [Glycine soja]